jgi:hypothetical protein
LVRVSAEAALDPIVAVLRPAVALPLRRFPDVPINLLELNSGDEAAGKPGAVIDDLQRWLHSINCEQPRPIVGLAAQRYISRALNRGEGSYLVSLLNRVFASREIDRWAADQKLAAEQRLKQVAHDLLVSAEAEIAKVGLLDGLLGQSTFISDRIAPVVRTYAEPVASDILYNANLALPDIVVDNAQWQVQPEYAESPEAPFDGAKDILSAAVPLVGGAAGAVAVPFAAVTTTTALFGLVSFTAVSWPIVIGGGTLAAAGLVTGILNTGKLKYRTKVRLRERVQRFISASLIEGTVKNPAILQQLASEVDRTAQRAKALW